MAKGRKYFVAALSWFLVFSWSTVAAGRPMVLHKSHLDWSKLAFLSFFELLLVSMELVSLLADLVVACMMVSACIQALV